MPAVEEGNRLTNNLVNYSPTETGCANPPNLDDTALIDTAASLSLLGIGATATESAKQLPGKCIIQPNGARMTTTKNLELLLTKLPKSARQAHRLPGIVNNLLSVAELCDAGCEVEFHRTGCHVYYNGEIVMRGWRDPTNKLWRVPLVDTNQAVTPTSQDIMLGGDLPAFLQANSLYECNTTEDLIKFYHGCLLFPVKSTWLKAIKAGYFKGWSGLTDKRVQKYIKVVDETEKGHMNRVRQGQRSSKTPPKDDHMDIPEQTPTNKKNTSSL